MINKWKSIFEVEKKDNPTKLGLGEKIAGGTAIGLGMGSYGLGKSVFTHLKRMQSDPAYKEQFDAQLKPEIDRTKETMIKRGVSAAQAEQTTNDAIEHATKVTIPKIASGLENVGLGVAGTVAAGLAAHKLYKMYKNKKK